MAPFKIEAITRRHQVAPMFRSARPPTLGLVDRFQDDVRAGLPLRGLLYGVPIGLLMWVLIATLLWQFA